MCRSLRIALVTSHYLPGTGGVERAVAQIAERIAAAGHRVEVLTQTLDRTLPRYELQRGVTIRRFVSVPADAHLTVAPALLAFLGAARDRYHVVHAHNYHAFPALAAALCRPRILVLSPHYHGTGHGPLRRALHVPYRLCGQAIVRRAAAVVCVSAAEAALVRRHFGAVATRLRVIGHGVDVARIRDAPPFPAGQTTILCVGRLARYKQVHRLIQAMARLDEDVALRVVGDGPERSALEALCARLDLADRVTFLGRVDDRTLARWQRTAAVYVTLSQHEAYGLTILEALAAGAQVVASNIPAFAEQRRLGGGAISLVPVDAPAHDLAAAIRAAVIRSQTPPPLDAALLPSWDSAAAQTLRLYGQLVAR